MSATVDSRIVSMKFDSGTFRDAIRQSMNALSGLGSTLDAFAKKSFGSINTAASKVNLGGMASDVDVVNARFTALQTVATAALATIASKATSAGLNLVKSFTLGPISEGFSDYNAKLTSVKTVMNATGRSIEDVNGFFNQLDHYADTTVFNLSDMTGALAKFVNAGVSLEDAIPAIQGIGNMTALAGQGANEASIAYYNLSQSLAQGFLSTTDFKSLNLANVATKEWKQNTIDAAVSAGTLRKGADGMYTVLSDGSNKAFNAAALFNTELSRQWATADVLKDVLGDYGDKQTEIGKKAFAAAQDVKSLPMMMETLKAAVGTGWTSAFETILGNVNESTKLFTGLTNAIGGVIGGRMDKFNAMLAEWKRFGGRWKTFEGLRNIFRAIGAILKPIGQAFRDVFEPFQGRQLAKISHNFLLFSRGLIISKDTAESLRKIFRGLFSILDVGMKILGGVIEYVASTIGLIVRIAAPFVRLALAIAGAISDITSHLLGMGDVGDGFKGLLEFFIKAREALLGPLIDGLNKFVNKIIEFINMGPDKIFKAISKALEFMAPLLDKVGEGAQKVGEFVSKGLDKAKKAISDFFGGLNFSGFKTDALESMHDILEKMAPVMDKVQKIAKKLWDLIKIGAYYAAGAVVVAGRAVWDFFTSIQVDGSSAGKILDSVVGFFSKLGETISNLIPDFSKTSKAISDTNSKLGLTAKAGEGTTSAFSKIGDAISAVGSAIGGGLSGIWSLFENGAKAIGNFLGKIDILGVVSVLNMTAITAIVWKTMKLFKNLGETMADLRKNGMGTIFPQLKEGLAALQTGVKAALIKSIAISVGILAAALFVLSLIKVDAMGRAMGAILVLMTAVTASMVTLTKTMGPGGLKQMTGIAAAMNGMATAILILTGAIAIMARMDPEKFFKGLGFVALTLATLTAALISFSLVQGPVASASAGMFIIAHALLALSAVIILYSKLKWDTVWEGIKKMAVVIGMLGLAMRLMPRKGALAFSASLIVIAFALTALTPVLLVLGKTHKIIGKALAVIAVGLLLLFAAAAAARPEVLGVGLMILAGSILAIGAAVFLAGAGMFLFATGLGLLAAAIAGLAAAAPLMIAQFGVIIKTILKVFQALLPHFLEFGIALITTMVDGFLASLDQIARFFDGLIDVIIRVITKNFPKLIELGHTLLIQYLEGVRRHIGEVADLAADIIIEFINAVRRNANRINTALFDAIIGAINDLAALIESRGGRFNKAVKRLARAIWNNFTSLLGDLFSGLAGWFRDHILKPLKDFLNQVRALWRAITGQQKENEGPASDGSNDTQQGATKNLGKDTPSTPSGSGTGPMIRSFNNQIAGAIDDSVDLQPVVTPVLDLSEFRKTARSLGGLNTDLSLKSADDIAALESSINTNKTSPEDIQKVVKFEQNNYSPKALTPAEIYRNTRNQLSLAKEALSN